MLADTDDIVRQNNFIGTIEALSYVATGTRPDVAFAVNLLAQHAKLPGKEHWRCLQHLLGLMTVAASSCHAEFMALGLAARHGKWLKNLLDDITGETVPLRLLCDNTLAIRIAKDSSSNKQTKHSDREYFITNQLLKDKVATIKWVSSGNMSANIMTKPLGSVLHQRFFGQALCGG
ncbi:hypothetical protein O181_049170 [Austropuccinia psidii MF-1]|uniref:Reverse transcriptase Ty1/copia-type domain-containing protein n=1 Tax=Austropuccinia psidii MF-1 TaxID=1389203 RepID=A0A9Q3HPT6_9BASI|nr:hypothetical protein [Austropuccinia psidii MF-1]